MQASNIYNESGLDTSDGLSLFAERREKLRKLLRLNNLDALLVFHAPNRFYLSGFELHDPQPSESAGFLLVCADGDDWLATDSRYAVAAEKLWNKNHICIYGSEMAREAAKLCAKNSLLAGIEAKSVSWRFASRLSSALPKGHALVKCDGLVEKLRVIKDKREQLALEKSFQLNHKMFDWLKNEFVDSSEREISELELAWEVEKFFRENGAQELAFSTIVAAGKSAAQPHAIPGRIKLRAGIPLLVDAGCRVDNYCSDQTRSWWKGGNAPVNFSQTLELVRKAQQAAFEVMRPGATCKEADLAARAVFEKAGVAEAFNHGLGHGVGLETHEAPRLSRLSNETLEAGMVVTVEPGLYYPEWGGVRWENTVLVTDDGIKIL